MLQQQQQHLGLLFLLILPQLAVRVSALLAELVCVYPCYLSLTNTYCTFCRGTRRRTLFSLAPLKGERPGDTKQDNEGLGDSVDEEKDGTSGRRLSEEEQEGEQGEGGGEQAVVEEEQERGQEAGIGWLLLLVVEQKGV